MSDKLPDSETEWRERLTAEEYEVLRCKATERPFTGEYYHNEATGIYRCRACGEPLFSSTTKYDSGSGWPSFYAPLNDRLIAETDDSSHGMQRTEILCRRCGSHLGHVFGDGPQPTGRRYCVNSLSLRFDKA